MRGQADGFLEASKEPAARGAGVTTTTPEEPRIGMRNQQRSAPLALFIADKNVCPRINGQSRASRASREKKKQ